jgi:DNA polymerase-3 subunit beta
MQWKIEKKDLIKPLTILQGIVERRSSIPALSNVLIETDEDEIRLTTTDLETSIISHIPCSTIKQAGKICVSARKLYEIIRELPEETISIEGMENHWARISCGNALFNLSGLDPMEFPTVPSYLEEDLVPIESFDLREMVEKVIFCASAEESRYNLSGVFFEVISSQEKNLARMVATDGHRLALIDREGAEIPRMEKGAIIPKRGLNEVRKIAGEYPGEIMISLTETTCVVKAGSFVMMIRLIDGDFPDYRQVIPRESDKVIRLTTREFVACLRRISTIAIDRVEGVKFTFKKGGIELYSSTQDIGNAVEEFPANYEGQELSIGFNARYMLDAVNEIDEEEFILELKDEASAALIRPASGHSPLYVIMPMRV